MNGYLFKIQYCEYHGEFFLLNDKVGRCGGPVLMLLFEVFFDIETIILIYG